MGIPFGRYELLRRIAAGGMGEVYLARHAGLEGFEKLLVVKVLLPHLVENEEFTKMFLDEARIAARLNHPNIAQIFDLGEVGGAYFIAMEYIHGEDVKRIWKKAAAAGKPMPLQLAVRIAADAAAGLDYAHKAMDASNIPLGLVHRDVSPQNILVTFEGGVKVIDFGIARAAGRSAHTATGTLKGKYPYMSPEQATSNQLDHRSDIFALGVVLFEMATKKRLFARDSEIAILRAVAECEVPRPSLVNPAIDEQLEWIISKALAPTPEQRFKDAQEMRLALEEWLVHTRQQGSSAHLGAYLQELYAERLAEERVEGRPITGGDETPSGVLLRSTLSYSLRDAVARSAAATPEIPPRPERQEPHMAAPVETHRPGRRWFLGAGVIAAAVLSIALVWFGLGSSRDEPVEGELTVITTPPGAGVSLDGTSLGTSPLMHHPLPDELEGKVEVALAGFVPAQRRIEGGGKHRIEIELHPEPIDARPPDPGKLPEPEPQKITLRFTSRPAGATVTLGGEVIGTTPTNHELSHSEEEVTFVFRLPGHRPARTTVKPNSDAEVSATLRRVAVRQPRPEDSPLDIKTGR